jgi:hypothetical protein
MILDSGFRRNDDKETCPSMFVTPAKAGVQLKGFERKPSKQWCQDNNGLINNVFVGLIPLNHILAKGWGAGDHPRSICFFASLQTSRFSEKVARDCSVLPEWKKISKIMAPR